MQYRDRVEAGRVLARELMRYSGRDDVTVLALPRGGMPVGSEVAKILHAPLDVFVVRKLGVPGNEELAMGAIASGGVRVLNREIAATISIAAIEEATARETEELQRSEHSYRGSRPFPSVQGRILILVDDGLATGATMKAAVAAAKQHFPSKIIVAVPVAPADTVREVEAVADEVVCPLVPSTFHAVGEWYKDFSQTTGEEVRQLLQCKTSSRDV